jgi:death-on-curing protein
MHYLSKEELLDLHAYVLVRYGGLMGIKSQDRLNAVVQAPRQQMFGAELYPDVCSKAAVLTYMIIKNHPFVSGNDSTALMAMLRFLETNGLTLSRGVGSGDLLRLVRALNHSDINREGLDSWLRDNVVEIG